MLDLIIIGSGPSGLSCGLAAKKEGIDYLILEKGCITNSIYKYPIGMEFFTTRELIEIGGYPLNITSFKPTREEALQYYSKFVIDHDINIHTYEEVYEISGENNNYTIKTKTDLGKEKEYKCKKIVVSTGVFDNPRMLNIPGEDLSKVSHYFKEAHLYVGKKVVIIGGRNSAAEAALVLFRTGAEVTMVVRESEFSHLKYWVEPDLLNRIKEESIECYYESNVKEITENEVIFETKEGKTNKIENDFVLALTGYEPNGKLLRSIGVKLAEGTLKPDHNEETFETNVEGVYIAGVITAGNDSSRVFIENGRFHGEKIMPHIKKTL